MILLLLAFVEIMQVVILYTSTPSSIQKKWKLRLYARCACLTKVKTAIGAKNKKTNKQMKEIKYFRELYRLS